MIKIIKEIMNFIREKYKNIWWFVFLLFFSPTLIRASYLKWELKENKDDVRDLIKNRNSLYLTITVLLAFILWILEDNIDKNCLKWLAISVGYYAFSRVNEIFISFIEDASSHLKYEERSSTLKYHERIPLAMKSYLELIILYGVIAYALQLFQKTMFCCGGFNCELDVWKTIYYSGVTITTLGYGDITPNHFITELMAVYEVANGFSLIIVSFTVYVARSISDQEHKKF